MRRFAFYLMILVRTVGLTALTEAIWEYTRLRWHFAVTGETVQSATAIFGVLHALICTLILGRAWSECSELEAVVFRSVNTKDNEELQKLEWQYMEWKIKRIQPILKFFLITMSVFLTTWVGLIFFPIWDDGFMFVTGLAFVLAFFWEVAFILDAPLRWASFAQAIPRKWNRPAFMPWSYVLLGPYLSDDREEEWRVLVKTNGHTISRHANAQYH